MKQAALFDGFAFDPFPFQRDDIAMPEVDVGGGEIAEALMVAAVVVVLDEGRNLSLKIAWQEVVFEENAVLQRLVLRRLPQRLRDRKRGTQRHRSLDRLLQPATSALDLRRQDNR